MKKLRVGILGATGMVGQRFVSLLEDHPWFEVASVAASPRSAGKKYSEAVEGRWQMKDAVPRNAERLMVKKVEEDIDEIADEVDFVFSALDMDKEEIKKVEEAYAAKGIPVISNNSAHRWTEDIPMIIPEVNPEHISLIKSQQGMGQRVYCSKAKLLDTGLCADTQGPGSVQAKESSCNYIAGHFWSRKDF